MKIKPDYNLKSLFDIDVEELKQRGIKAMLFDLDSTVMASGAGIYNEAVYEWLCNLKKDFEIAIISNNSCKKYIDNVQQQSCFDVIGCARKPDTKIALEYLQKLGIAPENSVIVGDRPLTDILLGKRLGAKTILVDSITCDTESQIVRLVRALERLFIEQ